MIVSYSTNGKKKTIANVGTADEAISAVRLFLDTNGFKTHYMRFIPNSERDSVIIDYGNWFNYMVVDGNTEDESVLEKFAEYTKRMSNESSSKKSKRK